MNEFYFYKLGGHQSHCIRRSAPEHGRSQWIKHVKDVLRGIQNPSDAEVWKAIRYASLRLHGQEPSSTHDEPERQGAA